MIVITVYFCIFLALASSVLQKELEVVWDIHGGTATSITLYIPKQKGFFRLVSVDYLLQLLQVHCDWL